MSEKCKQLTEAAHEALAGTPHIIAVDDGEGLGLSAEGSGGELLRMLGHITANLMQEMEITSIDRLLSATALAMVKGVIKE